MQGEQVWHPVFAWYDGVVDKISYTGLNKSGAPVHALSVIHTVPTNFTQFYRFHRMLEGFILTAMCTLAPHSAQNSFFYS